MQDTPSQKRNPKGVGHVCSNCGQTVECDLNTDLYEALKDLQEHALSNVVVSNDAIRWMLNQARIRASKALAKAGDK